MEIYHSSCEVFYEGGVTATRHHSIQGSRVIKEVVPRGDDSLDRGAGEKGRAERGLDPRGRLGLRELRQGLQTEICDSPCVVEQ